jgi:hypothetical protein
MIWDLMYSIQTTAYHHFVQYLSHTYFIIYLVSRMNKIGVLVFVTLLLGLTAINQEKDRQF